MWGWTKKLGTSLQQAAAATSEGFKIAVEKSKQYLDEQAPAQGGTTEITAAAAQEQRTRLLHNPRAPWHVPEQYCDRQQLVIKQILLLTEERWTFLSSPPEKALEGWEWEFDAEAAQLCLELDPKLDRMRFLLVPFKVQELTFWRNYFSRIHLIRTSILDPSVRMPKKHIAAIPPQAAMITVPEPSSAQGRMSAAPAGAVAPVPVPFTPTTSSAATASIITATAIPLEPLPVAPTAPAAAAAEDTSALVTSRAAPTHKQAATSARSVPANALDSGDPLSPQSDSEDAAPHVCDPIAAKHNSTGRPGEPQERFAEPIITAVESLSPDAPLLEPERLHFEVQSRSEGRALKGVATEASSAPAAELPEAAPTQGLLDLNADVEDFFAAQPTEVGGARSSSQDASQFGLQDLLDLDSELDLDNFDRGSHSATTADLLDTSLDDEIAQLLSL